MGDIQNPEFCSKDVSFYQVGNYKVTEDNNVCSSRLLAVDRGWRRLLLGHSNLLTVIPFDSLVVNRNISPEILKNPISDINGMFSVILGPEGSKVDYLSLSNNGLGQRLCVSVLDSSNNSLFLQFFDLRHLYTNGPNAKPYAKFRVPEMEAMSSIDTSTVFTRAIDWHPELRDNVLGCVFSNGAFNLLRISDPDTNGNGSLGILVEYKKNKVLALSWSPKGKQIALSFGQGGESPMGFAQFQLSMPENDLQAANVPFVEKRFFKLPGDFADDRIVKLHWISTFTFLCITSLNDKCNAIFVTVPSLKNPDVPIKIINAENPTFAFGEGEFEDLSFEVIGESFVFFSNLSNNLGFVMQENDGFKVVESTDDVCGVFVETKARGLGYLRGDGKPFVIANKGTIGSQNDDFFVTYESSGILKAYLKTGLGGGERFLKVPDVQTNNHFPQNFPEHNTVRTTPKPSQPPSGSIQAPKQIVETAPKPSTSIQTPKQTVETTPKPVQPASANNVRTPKQIMEQGSSQKLASEMIAEFNAFFQANMTELKTFNQHVKECNFDTSIQSLNANIKSNFEVGRNAGSLLKDLDSESETALDTLLANIAAELSKPKPEKALTQSFTSKYIAQSNRMIEIVQNKASLIESKLKEVNNTLQSEWNNQSHSNERFYMISKDVFEAIAQHEDHIQELKKKVNTILAGQQKDVHDLRDDLSASMNKLKIAPKEARRPRRFDDEYRAKLINVLGNKERKIPITHCAIVPSVQSSDMANLMNNSVDSDARKMDSASRKMEVKKLIQKQESSPQILIPKLPESVKAASKVVLNNGIMVSQAQQVNSSRVPLSTVPPPNVTVQSKPQQVEVNKPKVSGFSFSSVPQANLPKPTTNGNPQSIAVPKTNASGFSFSSLSQANLPKPTSDLKPQEIEVNKPKGTGFSFSNVPQSNLPKPSTDLKPQEVAPPPTNTSGFSFSSLSQATLPKPTSDFKPQEVTALQTKTSTFSPSSVPQANLSKPVMNFKPQEVEVSKVDASGFSFSNTLQANLPKPASDLKPQEVEVNKAQVSGFSFTNALQANLPKPTPEFKPQEVAVPQTNTSGFSLSSGPQTNVGSSALSGGNASFGGSPGFGGGAAFGSKAAFSGPTAASTFGSSALAGGNSSFGDSSGFGSSPAFGSKAAFSSPTAASTFGSGATFGGSPAFGMGGQQSAFASSAFTNLNTTSLFGGNSNVGSLSFSSFVSGDSGPPPPNQPNFGAFNSESFSGRRK